MVSCPNYRALFSGCIENSCLPGWKMYVMPKVYLASPRHNTDGACAEIASVARKYHMSQQRQVQEILASFVQSNNP